jgi:hypothetical protein
VHLSSSARIFVPLERIVLEIEIHKLLQLLQVDHRSTTSGDVGTLQCMHACLKRPDIPALRARGKRTARSESEIERSWLWLRDNFSRHESRPTSVGRHLILLLSRRDTFFVKKTARWHCADAPSPRGRGAPSTRKEGRDAPGQIQGAQSSHVLDVRWYN